MKKWIELASVLLLLIWLSLPLWVRRDGAFEGSDNQARGTITQLRPGYAPWFSPLWQPGSSEVESGLFALQAAFGGAVLGYVLGLLEGRRGRH